jgi:hypothetical protein
MFHPCSRRSLLTILTQSIAGLVVALQLAIATASAQVLVGNPYVTGFEGWMSTYVTAPTQVGQAPSWGVLLTPDPLSGQMFLFEASDGREADAVTTAMMGDGKYKPYLMINTADTTPANYTVNYQLATMDNDGFGVVFGYQDNNNYFRVGFREQADGNLGFEEGTSVQKVVNGVITNLANSQAGFIPSSSGTPFDAKVVVNGTNWDIQVNNVSVLSGTDPDLKPGKYGVHSWAQREVDTAVSAQYGTIVGPISVSSATLNKTTNFANAVSPVAWRRLVMINSFGENPIAQGDDHGNFAQDFTNGTIRDDSNGNANASASAPNTDFVGPAIVVNSPSAAAMTNYRFTTRVENRDNDGIGVLFRVADDDTFYRINWASEGPGTGTARPPLGMSIQKNDNGTWTQVFTETTPKFLPADSVPFDLSVQVVGNAIKIDVLDDPEGTTRAFSYEVVDASAPILAGSVGFTNWGNGDGGNGAVYSAFRGDGTSLVTAISTITDLDLTVNRSTSNVTLTNNGTAALNIKQVSIVSDYGGALTPANWSSISNNYDEAPGNGTVDPDDPWTELAATAFELTEREQSAGGDGGTLTAGEVVNLGNIWQKSRIEDVLLQVELTDGTVFFSEAAYTAGPTNAPYARSDLNLDGIVNPADWAFYYPNMLADLTSLTNVQRALAGDLDLDGDNDVADFVLFKTDFEAAQGVGSFEAMLAAVPEPSTIGLICVAGLAAFCLRRRSKTPAIVVLFLAIAFAAKSAQVNAAPVDFTTFMVEHFPESDVGNFPLAMWTTTPTNATLNSDASVNVFYSPLSPLNKRIAGTITPGTDDDVVGLVFGFEPGDAQLGSTADYILLDWKGANQNFNFADAPPIEPPNGFHDLTAGGTMPVGLALSRVTGRPTADEFWQHQDLAQTDGANQGGVQQLARGSTLGSAPYNRTGGSHLFEVLYTSSQVQVNVDGVLQMSVSGNFPDGRFGLYTLNQSGGPNFDNFEIFDFIPLTLTVDRATGNVTLKNTSTDPIQFDYYEIDSASGSLNLSGWNSLDDQNFQSVGPGDHQKFQEAGGSDAFELAEVFLETQATFPTLAPNSMVSLGAAYNNSINGEDLVLSYRLPTGAIFNASIEYVGTAPGLMGDYNNNGTVDAADYVIWRKTDGSNQAGYNTWRTNFGRTAGSGSSLANSVSVPEPVTWSLVGMALLVAACRGRRMTE